MRETLGAGADAFGHWALLIDWSLGLGHWSFSWTSGSVVGQFTKPLF
jgi:hypothetical protein